MGLAFVVSTFAITWSDCGDSSFHGHVTAVTADPDPPIRHHNNTLEGTGSVNEDVTAGTINLPLGAGSMFLPGFPCPYSAGHTASIKLYVSLGATAPPGDIESILMATASNGDKLLCVKVDFHLAVDNRTK